MRFPGDNLQFETRTPAEEKLFDFFAVFNCAGAPDLYFDENLRLLRSITNRHTEVINKLKLYLQHVKGEPLRCEISHEIEKREALIRSMEKKELNKPKKVEKTNAGTER